MACIKSLIRVGVEEKGKEEEVEEEENGEDNGIEPIDGMGLIGEEKTLAIATGYNTRAAFVRKLY